MEFDTSAGKLLKSIGLFYDNLLKAIKEIRHGYTVDTPSAEGRYEALKRYSRNITELASKGKLDPDR